VDSVSPEHTLHVRSQGAWRHAEAHRELLVRITCRDHLNDPRLPFGEHRPDGGHISHVAIVAMRDGCNLSAASIFPHRFLRFDLALTMWFRSPGQRGLGAVSVKVPTCGDDCAHLPSAYRAIVFLLNVCNRKGGFDR
jgi:hypothetical protein